MPRWYRNTAVARDIQRENKKKIYDDYLLSEQWLRLRALALHRDQGECQVCHMKKATQVHHLTYEHFGSESLADLQSVCADCHKHIHGLNKDYQA